MRRKYILRKSFSIFFILVSLFCIQSIVPNKVQTQTTESANTTAQPFNSLTLEVAPLSQSFLPLQPISISIKLSNKTSQAALGYKRIGFNNAPTYVYVRKSGSPDKVMIRPLTPLRIFNGFVNVEVAPGETSEAKELITMGLSKYFPEPGSYELQVVMANEDLTQKVESNIVNVEIQSPTGADIGAYNLIKNSSFKDYLFSDAEFDEVKNTLETLNTRYPNSVYAKNSSFLLGKAYFLQKRYPQALANLLKLEDDRNFIFAEKVKDYLAQIRQPIQTKEPK